MIYVRKYWGCAGCQCGGLFREILSNGITNCKLGRHSTVRCMSLLDDNQDSPHMTLILIVQEFEHFKT